MNGVTVKEPRSQPLEVVDRFYSDDEIADIFPDDEQCLTNKLLRRAQAAEAEVERLQAIVDQLPKTVDGVPGGGA